MRLITNGLDEHAQVTTANDQTIVVELHIHTQDSESASGARRAIVGKLSVLVNVRWHDSVERHRIRTRPGISRQCGVDIFILV